MKYRKIGERFGYEERKLEVVEGDTTCHGCFFENLPWCFGILKTTGPCIPNDREDEKSVIFKEVKEL